jgi:hypothetical protein
VGSLARILIACAFALPVLACEYPDEGNMPLHRAVTRVKLLPETEAWAKAMHEKGTSVQYALHLEQTLEEESRCYWAVDVNADGRTWRRYYVTPDGKRLRQAGERRGAAARR